MIIVDRPRTISFAVEDNKFDGKIKFAIVMLIYNHLPDIESLLEGSKYAKEIVLVDNNSPPLITQGLKQISNIIGNKCSLIHYSVNRGVSGAYNDAIARLKNSIEFIFLFDHDAVFDSYLFNKTLIALKRFQNDRVGVIVPIVADDKSFMKSNLGIYQEYSIVHSTITSGIFISRKLFLRMGGFNSNLFVEGADYELTRRVAQAGYLLVRINMVLIVQEFEEPIANRNFIIKLVNRTIKYRSLVRIKINNCNIFRTNLSFYNKSRERELFGNLQKLRNGTLFNKALISIVIFLDRTEQTFVKLVRKIGGY